MRMQISQLAKQKPMGKLGNQRKNQMNEWMSE